MIQLFWTLTYTVWLLYLFDLVLLMVARRYQAICVDAFIISIVSSMGTRGGILHSQEGTDALYLTLETAVCETLAFGGQSTRSHPLSILLLLEGKK